MAAVREGLRAARAVFASRDRSGSPSAGKVPRGDCFEEARLRTVLDVVDGRVSARGYRARRGLGHRERTGQPSDWQFGAST